MARWTLQEYIKERKAQQQLWNRIRHLAPDPCNPNSEESTLFFYQQCELAKVHLDEAQAEEFERMKKERLSKKVSADERSAAD